MAIYAFSLLLILEIVIELVVWYYYWRVARLVIFSRFSSFSLPILVRNDTFSRFQLVCYQLKDGPTNRQTDGSTDRIAYRDARTHQKSKIKKLFKKKLKLQYPTVTARLHAEIDEKITIFIEMKTILKSKIFKVKNTFKID